MGRFGILYDDVDTASSSSPAAGATKASLRRLPASSLVGTGGDGSHRDATESTNDDLEYSDDESDHGTSSSSEADDHDGSDEDVEPPHPIGFRETRRGGGGRRRQPKPRGPSSRYAVYWGYPHKESVEAYKRRMGYAYPFQVQERLLSPEFSSRPPRQQFPPLEAYLDPKTASTRVLLDSVRSLALTTDGTRTEDDTRFDASAAIRQHEIQEIVELFAGGSGDREAEPMLLLPPPPDPLAQLSVNEQTEPYRAMQMDQRQVQAEVENIREDILKEHKGRKLRLMQIIKEQEDDARRVQLEIDRRQREAEQAEMQKQVEAQERLEEERRTAEDAQRAADAERDRLLREEREQQAADERERAAREEAAAAAVPEFVKRAHKLVGQLVQLRASVEPFEASNVVTVKRRRLQMKKLVAGKVNTLTENADKIRSVAAEVSQAIAAARDEDEQLKQQLAAGAPGVSSEMARGRRYLIDLLSSKVIVRVEAEGFNGTRGDGFPLANMLALVSTDVKELAPVLMAHIYTACPIAIPSLPKPAANASEEELMESLGMQKKDDGTFETFERFLQRTEVRLVFTAAPVGINAWKSSPFASSQSFVSLVAEIMASNPPTHTLFGGNEAAIRWLSHFLELLPEVPESPLPLLTAPVLDAFLAGAGHMLANVHPEAFQLHLVFIINDILTRLDEGPIGAPSATRLRKTIGNGVEHFKRNLPSKAIPELYYGASENTSHTQAPLPSNLTSQTPLMTSPFGPPAASNPFRASSSATTSSSMSVSATSQSEAGGTTTSLFGSSSPALLGFAGASAAGSSFSSDSPHTSGPSPFRRSSAAPFLPFSSSSTPAPFSSSSTMMDSGMDAAESSAMTSLQFRQGSGLTGSGATTFVPSSQSGDSMYTGSGTTSFGASSQSGNSMYTGSGTSSYAASSQSGGSGFTGSGTSSSFASSQSGGSGFAGSGNSSHASSAQSGGSGFAGSGTSSFALSSSSGSSGFVSSGSSSFAMSSQSSAASTTAPSPNPFLQPAPASFGVAPNPAPSPFGAFSTAAPGPSLFQAPLAASSFGVPSSQNATPFASVPANPSPFGSSQNQSSFSTTFGSASFNQLSFGASTPSPPPFGGVAATNASPFAATPSVNSVVSFGSAPSMPSPFGASSTTPFGLVPSTSPFGQTGMTGLGTSPFGQNTPFGQAPGSGFGTIAATPFASNVQQQQPSGYGGTKGVPCRFFAQGYCRFGANCKFSHDSPAVSSFNTPFGGPRR